MGAVADVIIVGGGVVGCATAFYLTEMGAKVKLFDGDGIAAHASGFAFGSLSSADSLVQKNESGLLKTSFALHRNLSQILPEISGLDYGFTHKPTALLAFSDTDAEAARTFAASIKPSGGDEPVPEWMTAEEIHNMEPRVSHDCTGGLLFNDSYQIDPYQFTLSLWYGASRRGAEMLKSNVSKIILQGGKVLGVEADGKSSFADAVVLTAGAWSSEILKHSGVDLKVEPLKGQILRIRVDGTDLPITFSFGRNYVASKPDGLVWTGTTEERVGFDESPSEEAARDIMANAKAAFPYIAGGELVKHTACLRPVAPDMLPIIGTFPSLEGLVVSTGAGRKGISMGPGMGMATAEIIMNGSTSMPVEHLSPDRFS